MQRAEVLDSAKRAVSQRNTNYGRPENNFERIARRWNAHLANIDHVVWRDGKLVELTGVDVAMMLVDVKIARLENNPTHNDSWIDIAGYAACGAEVASALDISEMTPQTGTPYVETESYGDGTPGCITAEAADDNVMPATLADSLSGVILPLHRRPGETMRDARDRTWREHREAFGQEKFGFHLGETVNLKRDCVGHNPGKVVGFGNGVDVIWTHWKSGVHKDIQPDYLRHGP